MSTPSEPPTIQLSSRSGLRAAINANGSLRRFDCDSISLLLFPGNELEGGPANLYLRHYGQTLQCLPLLGPGSRSHFQADPTGTALLGRGTWLGIHYSIVLRLAADAPAWFWHLRLENRGASRQQIDLIYAQDLALAPYGAVRMNEYYVSQYIDHMPLRDAARGYVLASRQNAAADGRNPWSLIGSLRDGVGYVTDALQFHGLASRRGDAPAGLTAPLPARRLQHEHSMAVIADAPLWLAPGESVDTGFFGCFRAHHPEASSALDLERVGETLALPEATAVALEAQAAASPDTATGRALESATLFSVALPLNGSDLDSAALQALFPQPWRHPEVDERGGLLSFFHAGDRHVVLGAKERQVLRPHGLVLRTGRHLTPDESALTSTVWMSGVFNSLLTQGHVSINRLLSTVRSYLGLFRSHGQRVFVELDGGWRLLNVPSAFELSPQRCRWIYRLDDLQIAVDCEARSDPHRLVLSIRIESGEPRRFLIAQHVALNGDDGLSAGAVQWWRAGEDIVLAPPVDSEIGRRFPDGRFVLTPEAGTVIERVTADESLFLDGRSRQEPYLCIVSAPALSIGLRVRAQLLTDPRQPPLMMSGAGPCLPALMPSDAAADRSAAASETVAQMTRLAEILPWYAQNALVHYLSPRGLEQYSGGGWGTRDVCQGPVELLLALGELAPLRDILLRVMSNQNPDGDWPQWFMFFKRERDIRAGDSHGDIVFWPLLVLAQYLIASGDAGVLDERLPFFDARGPQAGEQATLWQHVERALALIERRVISGSVLPAYGHGDWNDSLQPADPALREYMCSAWIATLQVQTLNTLADALTGIGRAAQAQRLRDWAQAVQRDVQRLLLVDGVLAGYAIFEPGRAVRYLLHPADKTTGLSYSSLAMIHAILEDMLTPAQAREHLRLIDTHLSGPDGVRLFDRPMPYHGGLQRIFQRAETATFFGREIGLMYTHAHLRFAQALARVGDAPGFFHALCQANPIAIRSIVPSATLRQANCYYSSSDAAFDDRYQASEQYPRVAQGTVALDGGWRVYSSGAGIALGLIVRSLLGLSPQSQRLRIDPVMPGALDGLRVRTSLAGRGLEVVYGVGPAGCGVSQLLLNEQPLAFEREANPYRSGAALVAMPVLLERLSGHGNVLKVQLG
jgi:cellobiose phosphorylase